MLAMLLVEDRTKGLNDSVAEYFPEAPKSWRPIMVRHLLTHTSGIPNFEGAGFNLRRNYIAAELVQCAVDLKLEFAAGARWSYGAAGYILRGTLMQRGRGNSTGI